MRTAGHAEHAEITHPFRQGHSDGIHDQHHRGDDDDKERNRHQHKKRPVSAAAALINARVEGVTYLTDTFSAYGMPRIMPYSHAKLTWRGKSVAKGSGGLYRKERL